MFPLKNTLNIKFMLMLSLLSVAYPVSAWHYNEKTDKMHTTLKKVDILDTNFIVQLDSLLKTTHLKNAPYFKFNFGRIDSCIPLDDGTKYYLLKTTPPFNELDELYINIWGDDYPDDVFGEWGLKYKTKYFIFPRNSPQGLIQEKKLLQDFDFTADLVIKSMTRQPIVVKWIKDKGFVIMNKDTFVFM
ncbi:MAG: hypothetical protein DBY35_13955 [Bacteroidales bacterium]|nr:MAG: hypothetical protein DBY35_13955 [Bacteroidales bacterium]